jgi:uncharacterized membrane protein YqjE
MSPEPASPGLFHSARKLLANLAGLAHTRLELLSTELQECSSAQRILIAESTAALAARGMVLDRAVAVARGIAARPLVFGSMVALAVVVGPRKILGWAARAAAFYGLTRRLAAALGDHPR